MANVTVELTAKQVIGAKNHFGTQVNGDALNLFRDWVANNANQWYTDSLANDLKNIQEALLADPSKIAAIKTALGV